jgi:hypothetical protein
MMFMQIHETTLKSMSKSSRNVMSAERSSRKTAVAYFFSVGKGVSHLSHLQLGLDENGMGSDKLLSS